MRWGDPRISFFFCLILAVAIHTVPYRRTVLHVLHIGNLLDDSRRRYQLQDVSVRLSASLAGSRAMDDCVARI